MPLNPQAILGHAFEPVEQQLNDRDCMLYALSLGVGADPSDEAELPYVFEPGLKTFPTLPVVLGHPGTWFLRPEMAITHSKIVHGIQRLELLHPLPASARLRATNRNTAVADKGHDKGAIVITERRIADAASGTLLARLENSMFCRADGGFGGRPELPAEPQPLPTRDPEVTADMPTTPNQALYYRLNGDRNPLHASPSFAAAAGFPRPILHGLCSFGIAAHALMRHTGEALPLRTLETRFSSPVYPGETLRFDIWREGDGRHAFRARVVGRGVTVLDRGRATFAAYAVPPAGAATP